MSKNPIEDLLFGSLFFRSQMTRTISTMTAKGTAGPSEDGFYCKEKIKSHALIPLGASIFLVSHRMAGLKGIDFLHADTETRCGKRALIAV